MENWKIALIAGSLGAGAVLLVRGKRTAGMVAAGIGAVVLASEYPDKIEELQERIPEYTEHGMRILENLSQAGERFAEVLEKRGQEALRGIRSF